ncbi:unnamed protein product [Clavelina lepadiformis]|uniref:Uncharacterized protein n=1 Tax=Clavelina lepadiformis TaxID=159417 RepID=A0ABP0H593_CLALP
MSTTIDTCCVDRWINASNEMGFAWCTNHHILEHSAVVLIFNSLPVFTLEYGADLSGNGIRKCIFYSSCVSTAAFEQISSSSGYSRVPAKLVAKLPLNSGMYCDIFNSKKSTIRGIFMQLGINKGFEKLRARQLIAIITSIEMGDYQLLLNDCRDYVIRIATLLRDEPEFTVGSWNDFQEKMLKLRSIDDLKFEGAIRCSPEIIKNAVTASSLCHGNQNEDYYF